MKYISPPVVIGGLTVVTHDTKLTDDMVRAGINVNWGGPVVARY
jgi:outer membrane immunogenic protein